MKTETPSAVEIRPVVYDFTSPALFLKALVEYYQRSRNDFSIRARLREHRGCSPALISLMLQGRRRISRDVLPLLTQVFSLTASEVQYLDGLLSARFTVFDTKMPASKGSASKAARVPRNDLLSDWVNVYVKDCVHLRGFEPNVETVFRLLGGVVPRHRVQKAIEFLYREGFWRRTPEGRTVADENAVVTTSGQASTKIRQFHKAALEIAKQGLERFPPGRRKAYATVLAVTKENQDELRTMIDEFHKRLQDFIDAHPEKGDQLCQVVLHFTPLGGQHDQEN